MYCLRLETEQGKMRRADSGRTARESSASGLLAGKSLPGDKRFLPTLASADFESGPPGSYTNAAAPGGTSFGPKDAFPWEMGGKAPWEPNEVSPGAAALV